MPPETSHHSLSVVAPLPPGVPLEVIAYPGGLQVQGSDQIVPGETLYAPAPVPVLSASGESRGTEIPAQYRLTLTYHDLFGRMHAAIYDYTYRDVWEMRTVARKITKDLDGTLSRRRHQGPRGWLWRRGTGQTPVRRLGPGSTRGSTCGPARRGAANR
jgi:hypothetical protein